MKVFSAAAAAFEERNKSKTKTQRDEYVWRKIYVVAVARCENHRSLRKRFLKFHFAPPPPPPPFPSSLSRVESEKFLKIAFQGYANNYTTTARE
jgi:hypothetical protein